MVAAAISLSGLSAYAKRWHPPLNPRNNPRSAPIFVARRRLTPARSTPAGMAQSWIKSRRKRQTGTILPAAQKTCNTLLQTTQANLQQVRFYTQCVGKNRSSHAGDMTRKPTWNDANQSKSLPTGRPEAVESDYVINAAHFTVHAPHLGEADLKIATLAPLPGIACFRHSQDSHRWNDIRRFCEEDPLERTVIF